MAWDNVDKMLEKAGGGGADYLRFKAGESQKVVFLGEPISMWKTFGDPTEHAEPVQGASFKFKCNVAVLNSQGGWDIRILEQGKKTLKSVNAAVKKYGIEKVYEIVREGQGQQDTVYNVFFERDLTAGDKAKIGKLKLFPLYLKDGSDTSTAQAPATRSSTPPGEDVPF